MSWNYNDFPNHEDILRQNNAELLKKLFSGQLNFINEVTDTRNVHRFMFMSLTSPNTTYFAGNYRGSNYPALRSYEVRIGKSRGTLSSRVLIEMEALGREIERGFSGLDSAYQQPNSVVSKAQKLRYIVSFAAEISVKFLVIHPYADGNGHMSRFIVFAILYCSTMWRVKYALPFMEFTDTVCEYIRDAEGIC